MELSWKAEQRKATLWQPPIPKEHGAWSMLLVAAALGAGAAGKASTALVLFLPALIFLFMARYPLSLLIKNRRQSDFGRLFLWLGIYLALTFLFALPTLFLFRLWLLLPIGALAGVFLLLHLYLVSHKLDRRASSELLEIAGLSLAAPAAYYVSTGNLGETALLLGLLKFLYSGCSVFYVKMKVRQRAWREQSSSLKKRWGIGNGVVFYQWGLFLILGGLVWQKYIPALALLAFLPLLAKALHGVFLSKGGASIKQIGFTELGHSLLFLLLLIGALRLSTP